LRTGQVGRLDKDGYLVVRGPKDEQFKLEDGTVINPREVEREFCGHPFVDDAIVCGEGKGFLVLLMTPDDEEIERCAKEHKMNKNDFLNSPQFNDVIKKHVDSVNERLPENEKVKKYKVLKSPFQLDLNEINAECEMNRDQIQKNNADSLDKMFPRFHFGHINEMNSCPFCYRTPVHWNDLLKEDGYEVKNMSELELKQLQREKIRNTLNILDQWKLELSLVLGEEQNSGSNNKNNENTKSNENMKSKESMKKNEKLDNNENNKGNSNLTMNVNIENNKSTVTEIQVDSRSDKNNKEVEEPIKRRSSSSNTGASATEDGIQMLWIIWSIEKKRK